MVVGDSGWLEKEKIADGVYRYERHLRIIDTTRIGKLIKQAHKMAMMAGLKYPKIRFGKDATEVIVEGIGWPSQ